jgi:hypothetical protein
MKKMLFITGAKGGPGKTLIAHNCPQALTRLRYQLFFAERTRQRFPRLKSERPIRFKNPTPIFRRY